MTQRPFQPLLAAQTPADVTRFIHEQVRYPVLASPKFDGVRAFVKEGQLLTRKLKPVKNELLQRFLAVPELEGVDGELIVGDPTAKKVFQVSMSAVTRHDHGFDEMPLTFYLFDYHDRDQPFGERLAHLEKRFGRRKPIQLAPGVFTAPVKHVLVTGPEALLHLEEQVVTQGFEGVMLRDPGGAYKQGRSTVKEGILLKLKRFEFDAAEVIAAYEQEANLNEATLDERGYTKRSSHKANKAGKDTLGGFTVKMLEGEFKGVAVDVGTGWTDEERRALWSQWQERPKSLHRRQLRVKHQLAGSKDRPRFPVFVGWL